MNSILASAGLLLLRAVVGVTAIAHGWQKIWTNGLDATAAGFAGMGIPLPQFSAPLAAYAELIGGMLLVLGLAARFAAALIGITMTVAMLVVHLSGGFFAADGGIEFVLLLAASAFALVFTGSGAISFDALCSRALFARRTRRVRASAA